MSRIPAAAAEDAIYSTAPNPFPSSSQNASYNTEHEMTSLARSPDGRYAVLAGEKIFKTIRINNTTITEKDDLRGAVTSTTPGDVLSASHQQLDIKDVQWSHSELSSTIITAAANGRITLYDVNRIGTGVEIGRVQGHLRQIHKISVNPHKANWLLSASQDGTIKLFDLRVHTTGQGASTFNATHWYKCNADVVRDVKWSPRDGMEFACATDTGVVQKWDVRQSASPVLKLNAHSKACRSISWHPDGNNLASGGLDQLCHVWDVSKTADRRQKPKYTIQTPAPISIVSWRPPKWTSTFEKWRAAQIAVVYDDTNPAEMQESTVHVWDFARPGLPFKEVFDFETSPTGLIWQGSDLLWTVGKDGAFTQTDIAFAARTVDNRSLSAISISSGGELLMALEKRILPARQRPVPPPSAPSQAAGPSSTSNSNSYTSNTSGPLAGTYRADAEDDLLGNFLNIRPGRRRRPAEGDQQNSASNNPSQPLPSLAESLEITGEYVNKQVVAYGHVPGTTDRGIWEYMSCVYLGYIFEEVQASLNPDPSIPPADARFKHIMEQFALAAEKLGWYRHAQSWRIISHSLGTTMSRRAIFHRDQRVARHKEMEEQREKEKNQAAKLHKEAKSGEVEPPRKSRSQELHAQAKSIISEEIESTSNMTTPLARPSQGSTAIDSDVLMLPPAVSTLPTNLGASSEPCTEGYDFYDTASIVPAIDIVAPQRKLPLRLDYPPPAEASTSQALRHHDSTESFEMFSTSEDSKAAKFDSSSDNDDKDTLPLEELPTSLDNESSWDSSVSFDKGKGKEVETSRPPVLMIQEPSLPNIEPKAPSTDEAEVISNEPISPSTTDPSEIIESDYLPQPGDPLFMIEPLSPEKTVAEWMEYETAKNALTPAAIVLLIKPLLLPGTIDDNQARQILLQYHQRLSAMELYPSATLLRKLCVPNYPAVYEQGRWGKDVGFKCGKCGTAMIPNAENPAAMAYCKKCKESMDDCSVCQQKSFPDTIDGGLNQSGFNPNAPEADLWVWCQGCQHGAHAACLSAWHAHGGDDFSDGQCPVLGCGHACIPGKYQTQLEAEAEARTKAELERQVRENSRYSGSSRAVRRDSEEVPPSNAVESVRGVLGSV